MKITNPLSDDYVETDCKGCMCHSLSMQFDDLIDGCCSQCGCPKNLEGYKHYRKEHPEKYHAFPAKVTGD